LDATSGFSILSYGKPKQRISIRDRGHLVSVCSASDVYEIDGRLEFKRTVAWDCYAAMRESRGSQFSADGIALDISKVASHKIAIPYRPNSEISATVWIYENRLKSSPRWFKVLDVKDMNEDGRYWEFKCRLVERSDDIAKPAVVTNNSCSIKDQIYMPLPAGINL
jgi:head-tail adaptor